MIAVLALAAAPLSCGAVTRPGIAELGQDGVWRGRAVDLCRAAAAKANGPDAPIAFRAYDRPAALRAAADDRIAFLTPTERAPARGLADGPVVATDRQLLVVKARAAIADSRALGGKLVCFIIGTRAEAALDAWAARSGVPVERLAFQEPDEMADAFDVGKCAAAAVDAGEMPDGARPLGPPLAEEPVMAGTPASAGAAWRALVAAAAR